MIEITPAPAGAPTSGPSTGLRLLAVHAHPDDEASKGAATVAKLVSEGAEVLVVTGTGGEAGSVLNGQLKDREAELMVDLPGVRRAEMAESARILGVQHAWLGFLDSGWPDADEEGNRPPVEPDTFGGLALDTVSGPLAELIRRFRPQVVTTYDETGGYPHPDHVRTHTATMRALELAADPTFPGGEPWEVSKVYYHLTFHKERLVVLHRAALDNGIESPYAEWLERWEDKPEDAERWTTGVECADFFHVRDQALLAHATQIDPTMRWFLMPLDLQKRIWPTEDYQLARTAFDRPEGRESDLFAGLRDKPEEAAA
jgi:mycothiol S-conjugate amidase